MQDKTKETCANSTAGVRASARPSVKSKVKVGGGGRKKTEKEKDRFTHIGMDVVVPRNLLRVSVSFAFLFFYLIVNKLNDTFDIGAILLLVIQL